MKILPTFYTLLFATYFWCYNEPAFTQQYWNKTTYANPQIEWVLNFSMPSKRGVSFPGAMTVDSSGNIYITGERTNLAFGISLLTVKYDAAGNEGWVAENAHEEGEINKGTAIVVSQSGNIYMAGYSCYKETGEDYIVIKYDTNGIVQWFVRYNGLSNGNDRAVAIALDLDENVYVIGESFNQSSGKDIITIKYDQTGQLLWTATHNGTYNLDDQPLGLKLDSEGCAFVLGLTQSYGGFKSFSLIRYTPAGEEQWVVDEAGGRYEKRGLIAIDRWNNIFFAREYKLDITTSKYSSSGEKLWEVEIQHGNTHPNAITTDKKGNVYVTGASRKFGDNLTVKFDSSGVELWKDVPDRRSLDNKEGIAIVADKNENVFVAVAGKSNEIKKYDSLGKKKWTRNLEEPDSTGYLNPLTPIDLFLDQNDEIVVVGHFYGEHNRITFKTAKYDTNGNKLWRVSYDNNVTLFGLSGLSDTKMEVDQSGNIYLSGNIFFDYRSDHFIIKYNSNQEQLWMIRSSEPHAFVQDMAIDAEGYIILIGYDQDSEGNNEFLILKYDSNGALVWVQRFNEPGLSRYRRLFLAIDPSGNVYVLGGRNFSGQNHDFVTLKYAPTGQFAWVQHYDSPNGVDDLQMDIQADQIGNVYVVGNSLAKGNEITTVKYSTDGEPLWSAKFDTIGRAKAIAFAQDSSGCIYIAAVKYRVQGGGGREMLILKYGPNGKRRWIKAFNRQSIDQVDEPSNIIVDREDHVYVVGFSANPDERNTDFATIKYSTSGEELWARFYNGFTNSGDEARMVVLDSEQNVYVTGQSSVGIATVKYDPDGEIQWSHRYRSSSKKNDFVLNIATDTQNNIYVNGLSVLSRSFNNNSLPVSSMTQVIKYSQSLGTSIEESSYFTLAFKMYQNYPNPFNPTSTIEFTLPKRMHVKLKVYDISGKEVAVLADKILTAGNHKRVFNAAGLPSGIYFYRLKTKDFVQSKKLTLLH